MLHDLKNQESWILEIMKPLSEGYVGIDVQYDEDFCSVQFEIEKLSNTNFEKVKWLSIRLLSKKTKDLRVLGYLILACVYLEDVKTLVSVFEVYEYFILHYWGTLYPKREKSRRTAVNWLNDLRFIQLLRNKLLDSHDLEVKQLMERIESLNLALIQVEGESSPQFLNLYKCLREIVESKIKCTAHLKKSEITETNSSEAYKISSKEDVNVWTRAIIGFFEVSNQRIYAAAFSRALCWSGLNPIVEIDNKTIFSPPSETDQANLKNALESFKPEGIYQICERLFLNKGGHVNFDLQYYAFQAAIDMGDLSLSLFLESEFKSLIKRIPKLCDLLYRDGTPLMSEKTRHWVKASNEDLSINIEINLNDYKTILENAKKQNKTGKWVDLLKEIQQFPVKTGRDEFHKQFAMAIICLEEKRFDIALPLLEELTKTIHSNQLTYWEPDLAVLVWVKYREVLLHSIPKVQGCSKDRLNEQLRVVTAALCCTDITFTVSMI